ncbi:glucose-1-phosphate adenylyltransferase [Chitinivibrio alkaliphilus]|uniref:Glucose-1-phosphate adenylyltransferase n=1 Tax=Chitinivibrio alkaliphilus ACht1 TaxID=1313304 RepID=U7DD67_9BACT|nr:glucose-1-phosphate adenylyltransferase [Chitinivibrio alkaliphilus]ERP38821.1 glucose-1-phosphate adenylyltransferase [Chitinivibrio alkaliphilus ACht1]
MDTFNRVSGHPNVMAMVMAGGEGSRLYPLTKDRAKPAVIFGGKYRIIDFVLNNFVNSGIYKIKVLTQFKADSLIRHITGGWTLSPMLGQYVDPVPAQMRTGKNWYQGTADAIYQNLNLIKDENPDYLAVFGADHIYKMDISLMLKYHISNGAVATVAAIPKPIDEASAFGVIEINENGRMIGFQEKPAHPKPIPGNPEMALCSMGNYIFTKEFIVDRLCDDADDTASSHDFGKDIIPAIYEKFPVYVYNFANNVIPGETKEQSTYWEDVGTIEAYYRANMTLRDVIPDINLYNSRWPIRTKAGQSAPSKFVFGSKKNEKDPRVGQAIDSLISGECIISGSEVINSVLSRGVRVHSYSRVEDSIVFPDVEIGDRCKIRRAIIDRDVKIPAGTEIGFDIEKDRERYFVSESGIVIVS